MKSQSESGKIAVLHPTVESERLRRLRRFEMARRELKNVEAPSKEAEGFDQDDVGQVIEEDF